MSLEKTTRMNYLFDFYQELLTPKQRNYMAFYYLDDYSLGEIAEEYQVSRQAVYDNIKRTEAMLEQYEEKLLLFKKFQERKQLLGLLKSGLAEIGGPKEKLFRIVEDIDKLD
ncbi:putative DNA-binding protein [Bacillus marinisedimentorum]|uniref:putative DNA-binding protein n=1 Tax=Bacillus marinisedimentorum TaxID=1821260 RepID=UPI0007E0E229|nr:putative DNA-binding protein [Bacillus marinisedimentorum]